MTQKYELLDALKQWPSVRIIRPWEGHLDVCCDPYKLGFLNLSHIDTHMQTQSDK